MTLPETTKTHNDHTKIHDEDYKGMHTDSPYSMYKYETNFNSTRITKDHIKHLKTATATSYYIYEISATAVYSEPPYMAAASTEAFGTGLITASVSAQDFTSSLAPSYASNTVLAMPTYYMQSTFVATYSYATGFTPSTGFAATSQAVFRGSCGRRSVDYLLVAVLPTLVGMFMWA
jgi:hypothetical protein